MPAPVLVLAGVGILSAALVSMFAAFVIGIHRGNRRHLINAPRAHSDAFARNLLVGIRYPAYSQDHADEETGDGE